MPGMGETTWAISTPMAGAQAHQASAGSPVLRRAAGDARLPDRKLTE